MSVEDRWLLVADIEGSVGWADRLGPENHHLRLDRWFRRCRSVVERSSGTINKYMGDGFLADWTDGPAAAQNVCHTLAEFQALQGERDVPFRVVVHYGEVTVSGIGTNGEEGLLGAEVTYVFRMEKVAAKNRFPVLISRAAAGPLSALMKLDEAPPMDVPGFGASRPFFSVPKEILSDVDPVGFADTGKDKSTEKGIEGGMI